MRYFKTFAIERTDTGWEETNNNEKSVLTMHDHIGSVEERMHKHYKENNSIVGGLRPDEYIHRLEIDTDGSIRYYINSIER